jgi:hypothetical protein
MGTRARNVLAAVPVAAVLALTVAACSKKPDTPSGTNSSQSPGVVFGASPSTSQTGTPGSTGAPATTSPSYPKDARSYGFAILKAWANLDYNRLSQLGVQAMVQQIRDSTNGQGNPNSQWTYKTCQPGDVNGHTDCIYHNVHGDKVVVTLNNSQLGFPTAGLAALLERTTYPDDPGSYVGEMLLAVADGNTERVVRLSNATVAAGITCTIGGSTTTVTPIDGTYSRATVSGLGVDLGKMFEFKVLTKPGGKAGAVKELLAKNCGV